jgi:PBP1b-binding outer membrane lipoprotein LpoB
MKKPTIMLFVFASILLLIAGCSSPKTAYGTEKLPTAPTESSQVDDIQVIEGEVGEVANLDSDIGLDDLEGLDKDLDLGL